MSRFGVRRSAACAVVAALLACAPVVGAHAVLIDFEGLADGAAVSNQFAGLTFANTIILKSGADGGSLNEIDFPPHSGVNVINENGGPITIDFASPVTDVSAFFTYAVPVTLTAFDAGLNPVATDTSDFNANFVTGGDAGSSPNEQLSVAFAGGILRVTMSTQAGSSQYTADDLSYTPTVRVVEPSTLLLFASGLLGALRSRRVRFSNAR
jgi:hypothetical protein